MIITAKLGATALALCVMTAGLAVAGVTLPGVAGDVAETAGLPNQADDQAGGAGDVEGASQDTDVRQDAKHREDGDADAKGNGNGDDVSAQNNDAGIGDEVSDLAQGLREATTEERQQFGQTVKDMAQNQELPSQAENGSGNADTHSQNGETNSESGIETGQTQSQEGQAKGDEVSGEQRPDTPAGSAP